MHQTYTLFYCPEDGKLHQGTCREEKEALVDVKIGDVVGLEGYRGDGLTLTLTGLEFETTADMALVVPGNTTIVLEQGESRLAVHPKGPEANAAVLYSQGDLTITGGEGSLCCDAGGTSEETCLWSRAICARYGDLSIRGGRIHVIAGPCSRKAGGYYAGGRLFGGEHQKGAITITGGTVTGTSAFNVIRATEDLLTIGPNAKVENSSECSGGEWHGSYLDQANRDQPVKITF